MHTIEDGIEVVPDVPRVLEDPVVIRHLDGPCEGLSRTGVTM